MRARLDVPGVLQLKAAPNQEDENTCKALILKGDRGGKNEFHHSFRTVARYLNARARC